MQDLVFGMVNVHAYINSKRTHPVQMWQRNSIWNGSRTTAPTTHNKANWSFPDFQVEGATATMFNRAAPNVGCANESRVTTVPSDSRAIARPAIFVMHKGRYIYQAPSSESLLPEKLGYSKNSASLPNDEMVQCVVVLGPSEVVCTTWQDSRLLWPLVATAVTRDCNYCSIWELL